MLIDTKAQDLALDLIDKGIPASLANKAGLALQNLQEARSRSSDSWGKATAGGSREDAVKASQEEMEAERILLEVQAECQAWNG